MVVGLERTSVSVQLMRAIDVTKPGFPDIQAFDPRARLCGEDQCQCSANESHRCNKTRVPGYPGI